MVATMTRILNTFKLGVHLAMASECFTSKMYPQENFISVIFLQYSRIVGNMSCLETTEVRVMDSRLTHNFIAISTATFVKSPFFGRTSHFRFGILQKKTRIRFIIPKSLYILLPNLSSRDNCSYTDKGSMYEFWRREEPCGIPSARSYTSLIIILTL